ncbi:hypothetical protein ACIQ7D_14925 [Streptomyces sp. NPDC096310]|uniref:hypothetical protein n=1 Tax=Streptomyces sp. NPDC096310 TaxID=3366082 RepID=UPI00380C69F7
MGTLDVTGDGIPDIWAVHSNGSVRLHTGGRAALSGTGTDVIVPSSWWKTRQRVG